jgi:hypothetical protein
MPTSVALSGGNAGKGLLLDRETTLVAIDKLAAQFIH